MQDLREGRQERQALDERVRLEKIARLKEELKTVRGMADEMSLLNDLTQEISALRHLREPRY